MKRWPIRSRLAVWTAFFLTVELIVFGIGSGWVIYSEQLEAFREIRGQPEFAHRDQKRGRRAGL